MKNYIDIEVTTTERHYFYNDADMGKIVEIIKETGTLDDIINDDLGFMESEMLSNYEENPATIVVYENNEQIYST